VFLAAALGLARAESATSAPFDGAPWANHQLFFGATSPSPPSLQPPSVTGSPGAEHPNCQYGTGCADCGPGQPLSPPEASPPPLRAGTRICTTTCFFASDAEGFDGGPSSEFPTTCVGGTDCVDCGACTVSPSPPSHSSGMVHTNNYLNAGGSGGPGSKFATCAFGTDCIDFGPRVSMPSPPPRPLAGHPPPNLPPSCCQCFTSNFDCDDGGPGSECLFCVAHAVVRIGSAVMCTSSAVTSTQRAVVGTFSSVVGNLCINVDIPRVMGTNRAIVDTDRAVTSTVVPDLVLREQSAPPLRRTVSAESLHIFGRSAKSDALLASEAEKQQDLLALHRGAITSSLKGSASSSVARACNLVPSADRLVVLACLLVTCAFLLVVPAHVLDGRSILTPPQLVHWGCMLMGSLMAWHHRFAKPPYTRHRPRQEHGLHVALTLIALYTMLPCTKASGVPGLDSVQPVPSHRRELQTEVNTATGLTSALANTAVTHIVLAPGTYNLTAELSITRSVALEAAVAGSVVLNAQASSSSQRRVLTINLGSSGVVQLIGLSITGGYASYGGGVFVQGGTVAISSCTISGNTATSLGGGVFVAGGTDTVSISSCTISGNTAPNSGQAQGGGVFVSYGTVTIASSSITGNFALYQGGGIYVQGGTVAISSCTISGNTAPNVRARVQKFPSPMAKLLTCLPRLTLAQLRTLWSTTGGACHRDLEKVQSPG
jgi:hypothetical protein